MSQGGIMYESNRISHQPRVREVLRVAATMDKPSLAREIILEWLENEAKTDLPEAAFKGDAFRHAEHGRTFAAIRAQQEGSDTWALRFVEPDEGTEGLEWTTEVATREQPGQEARFSVRSLVKSSEAKLRNQPVVPRFLEHVATECVLEQGAAKIEKDPWIVESDYDAANLAEFLVDPDRRTPAFVLTVPEESEDPNKPLLDPVPLASDTLGTAKVIVLPAEYTWKLTNRFGKRLSVYRGAMRVYLPGFREDTDPEGGHDLFMPHRMDTEETAARLGSLLRWMAARESLRHMRLDHEVLAFASVLVPSITLAVEKAEKDGLKVKDQLATVKEQLGVVCDELVHSTKMQQWLTEDNKALEGRLRESEAKQRMGGGGRGRPMQDRGGGRPRPRYGPSDGPRDGRDSGGYDRRPRGYDRPPRGYDRPPRRYDRYGGGPDRDSGDGGRRGGGYDRRSQPHDRDQGDWDPDRR